MSAALPPNRAAGYLRKILVVSLWLAGPALLSGAQEKAPVISQDPLIVELPGKVVCLAEEMSEMHEVKISAAHEHLYGFKTTNGVYYTLLRNKNSEALFSDAEVRSKNLVIKGRVFPKSQLLEVTSLRSIRNGRLHEIYYYCQVCEINSVSPGICECCREPTERVEKPLEEKGVTPKAKRKGQLYPETRSPKSETRKKSEARNLNFYGRQAASFHLSLPHSATWFRPSDFGLLSDFGIRTSDFPAHFFTTPLITNSKFREILSAAPATFAGT